MYYTIIKTELIILFLYTHHLYLLILWTFLGWKVLNYIINKRMDFNQIILEKNIRWKIIKILTLHPCRSYFCRSSQLLAKCSIPLSVSWKQQVVYEKDSSLFWGHFWTWHFLRCIVVPELHLFRHKNWEWGHILSIVSYTNLDFYWRDKVLQRGVYTDIFTWDIAVSGQECYLGNPLFYIICDIFCFSCLDVT